LDLYESDSESVSFDLVSLFFLGLAIALTFAYSLLIASNLGGTSDDTSTGS